MQPIIDNIKINSVEPSHFPRFNIMNEDGGAFVIELAVPGYALGDLSQSTVNGNLVISESKTAESRPNSYIGIPITFSRTFPMLDIDSVSIALNGVSNGLLTITITNNT